MHRRLRLHDSALSPSEYDAYSALLEEIDLRECTCEDMTELIGQRFRINADRLSEVMELVDVQASERAQVTNGLLLATLRLLAHAPTCDVLTKDHTFIQSKPLVRRPKNPFHRQSTPTLPKASLVPSPADARSQQRKSIDSNPFKRQPPPLPKRTVSHSVSSGSQAVDESSRRTSIDIISSSPVSRQFSRAESSHSHSSLATSTSSVSSSSSSSSSSSDDAGDRDDFPSSRLTESSHIAPTASLRKNPPPPVRLPRAQSMAYSRNGSDRKQETDTHSASSDPIPRRPPPPPTPALAKPTKTLPGLARSRTVTARPDPNSHSSTLRRESMSGSVNSLRQNSDSFRRRIASESTRGVEVLSKEFGRLEERFGKTKPTYLAQSREEKRGLVARSPSPPSTLAARHTFEPEGEDEVGWTRLG
ncbi:uncharacterized protein L969DRAFT_102881 [Mixia osmundae IAM 14324]|uniref:Uncharacterized protein n=1 Tax=Mixia osmundae (strain CBS 9802 / IAM 14324 / JCM 22182 / KY 12970) TaxID=764103 RepID=G7E8R1_MIXOS|nr:uncharacterized protein L969DRAFT_102881 [Mixia osmundae IAM 14324]KEI40165.1 hypothetical protein L969DRAFT_102881 [Mixia osmundae IAM 14324]GAA99529.1 hypothetical protein E5Q_06230 [Mixia osmundae IAM 14324]